MIMHHRVLEMNSDIYIPLFSSFRSLFAAKRSDSFVIKIHLKMQRRAEYDNRLKYCHLKRKDMMNLLFKRRRAYHIVICYACKCDDVLWNRTLWAKVRTIQVKRFTFFVFKAASEKISSPL